MIHAKYDRIVASSGPTVGRSEAIFTMAKDARLVRIVGISSATGETCAMMFAIGAATCAICAGTDASTGLSG